MSESIHEFARKEIAPLLENDAVRRRFERQRREYLHLRAENPKRPLPFDSEPPYELCEMYALLAATHDECYGEAPVYPLPLIPSNDAAALIRYLSPPNQAWRQLCANVMSYASATPAANANPITMSKALDKLRYSLKMVKQDLKATKATRALEFLPGAIKFGDATVELSGKPMACIQELSDAFQHRLDWRKLRDRVWDADAGTAKGTITDRCAKKVKLS